jgi:hypothetical protein
LRFFSLNSQHSPWKTSKTFSICLSHSGPNPILCHLTRNLLFRRTFVTDYKCTNREGISDYGLRESSRSFPSGKFISHKENLNFWLSNSPNLTRRSCMYYRLHFALSHMVSSMSTAKAAIAFLCPVFAMFFDAVDLLCLYISYHRSSSSHFRCHRRFHNGPRFCILHMPYIIKQLLWWKDHRACQRKWIDIVKQQSAKCSETSINDQCQRRVHVE